MSHAAVSEYPKSPPSDRRRASRVGARLPVEIWTSYGNCPGVARDVGVGGMFIQSDVQPGIGEEVEIWCSLPGSAGMLRLPAVARWNGPDGFGVQFALLGAHETHALASFVASLRTRK